MNSLLTIKINAARFFAHHGLYEEERKVPNEFVVDLAVSFIPPDTVVNKMKETINYVSLYELVKKHMLATTDLIETLATAIAEDIHIKYPQTKKITISIVKKFPPVINFSGNVDVTFTKEF